MSALARYFKQRGDEVSGYDRVCSPLTEQLEHEGIAVHYDDRPDMIPDNIDLAIYTSSNRYKSEAPKWRSVRKCLVN